MELKINKSPVKKDKLVPMASNESLGDKVTHFMKSGSCYRPDHQRDALLKFKQRIIPEWREGVRFEYDVWFNTNELFTIRKWLYTDFLGRGIYVKTLDGLIDTKAMKMMAPLVIGLLSGLAEVERNLIAERQRESVEYRRRNNGNLGGRPQLEVVKKENVWKLRREGNSLRKIVKLTGVSLSAVQRACKEEEFLQTI